MACAAAHHQPSMGLPRVGARSCGNQTFRVTGMPEDNKPRNILEEIVWCGAWRRALRALQPGAPARMLPACSAAPTCRLWPHPPRWKAKEVEAMRDRTPLMVLKAGVKAAQPARDFKAALLKKAAETGDGAGAAGGPSAGQRKPALAHSMLAQSVLAHSRMRAGRPVLPPRQARPHCGSEEGLAQQGRHPAGL